MPEITAPDVHARPSTQNPARMTPATSTFYDAVLDRRLTYAKAVQHHARALEAHVANARVLGSRPPVSIAKADKDSPRIDLAVCESWPTTVQPEHERALRSS
ncbi:MAG: hypothetical protein M3256_23035 [Actinomycetota bacterium]|nr:hypothetical protein [Actinomycetota bacterium]